MNKIPLFGILLLTSSSLAFAEYQPYVGVSFNSFSITGKEFSRHGTSGGSPTISNLPETSTDTGSSTGLTLGAFIDDHQRIHVSHFSGEENDSHLMTVTATSISMDYSFNDYGIHQGFFLGAGYARIKIESKAKNINGRQYQATSSSGSGLLARGGYQHKFDHQLFLEAAMNLYMVEISHPIKWTDPSAIENVDTRLNGQFSTSNIYIALNYVF